MSMWQQIDEREMKAALRVANIIGNFKQVIVALASIGVGLTAVVMFVGGLADSNASMLLSGVLVAAVGGVVVMTYWALFGWFEYVLRMLVRIAGSR